MSQLIQTKDNSFITVMSERYHTDRSSLRLLIDKIEHRESMVEVGSLAGFSTRLFSLYFDKVISVDPYISGYDEADMNSQRERLEIAQDIFTLRFIDDPRVEQINEKSNVAALMFDDDSIPFVYIDAGHNYDSVKEDIKCWAPKVKHHHYIAGDDYKWPGVSKAVSEAFADHAVIENRWIAQVNRSCQ